MTALPMTARPTTVRTCALAFLLLALAWAWPAHSGKGPTGLYITGDTSGFFLNPTMTRVYVQKVDPGSCAETSGFAAGDEIVSIEGKVLAGRKARELMAYWKSLKRDAGVRFRVRRGDAPMDLLLCGEHAGDAQHAASAAASDPRRQER